MKWCRIDLTREQIAKDVRDEILKELIFLKDSQGLPKGFGVFEGRLTEKGLSLYFTPNTAPLSNNIIYNYKGTPCEKPSKEDIESFFYGYDSTWSLLDS